MNYVRTGIVISRDNSFFNKFSMAESTLFIFSFHEYFHSFGLRNHPLDVIPAPKHIYMTLFSTNILCFRYPIGNFLFG